MTVKFDPLIRIVDDDEAVLKALGQMLECEGYRTACYQDARTFLASDAPSVPGCLILDVRMPQMSGLELHQELNRRKYDVPIVFLSGHGDLDMAVAALKDGAVDFIQKPIDTQKLLASVARAVRIWRARHNQIVSPELTQERLASLTERERQTVALCAKGCLNREIAQKLRISDRTVESHRQSAFKKMGVKTVPELVAWLNDAAFADEDLGI